MNGRTSEKITFAGAAGHELAARLDRPVGPVAAYALFAHCFTCSKDVFAAARISAALAERGIAVLRFDFTGLGHSGGEFANTGFSSNVADLVAAAEFLRSHERAPTVLIGHSLGGAAALAAAGRMPELRAVVTINAPSDPAHVLAHFGDARQEIARNGAADVTIGGRSFTITRDFVEDLHEQRLLDGVRELRRALLILHAPHDPIVAIDNASRIFQAARHPKSFVSLDDADHLLTRREDAVYVADVVAAWASRYVEAPPGAPAQEQGTVLVTETGAGRFAQTVVAGRHRLAADEPEAYGGDDSGPSPYDYLLAALGACTSMTIRMYAERKKIRLDGVSVRLRHAKIHAADCADCDAKEGKIDHIEREIALSGDLDEDTEARLMEIADRCPVHKTLHAEVKVTTRKVE